MMPLEQLAGKAHDHAYVGQEENPYGATVKILLSQSF
jgi:hypothetical protein